METERQNDEYFSFFAMLDRMQYINRWGLMRNTKTENNKEHTMDVAVVSHALVLIRNRFFPGSEPAIDPLFAAAVGLFHDATEIITGDLPTPVKYKNREITSSYKEIEKQAKERLLTLLPNELRDDYRRLFSPDMANPVESAAVELVKAADKICAYIKCVLEEKAGNREFCVAKEAIYEAILKINLPEVDYFMEHFVPSYGQTLDQISG